MVCWPRFDFQSSPVSLTSIEFGHLEWKLLKQADWGEFESWLCYFLLMWPWTSHSSYQTLVSPSEIQEQNYLSHRILWYDISCCSVSERTAYHIENTTTVNIVFTSVPTVNHWSALTTEDAEMNKMPFKAPNPEKKRPEHETWAGGWGRTASQASELGTEAWVKDRTMGRRQEREGEGQNPSPRELMVQKGWMGWDSWKSECRDRAPWGGRWRLEIVPELQVLLTKHWDLRCSVRGVKGCSDTVI